MKSYFKISSLLKCSFGVVITINCALLAQGRIEEIDKIDQNILSKLDHRLVLPLLEVKEYEKSIRNAKSPAERAAAQFQFETLLDRFSNYLVIERGGSEEPAIEVLIKTLAPQVLQLNSNIQISQIHQGENAKFITARIKITELEKIAAEPSVIFIEASRILRFELDQSALDVNADDVWRGNIASAPETTITGKGVFVGIIDGRPRWSHETFRDAKGNTRFRKMRYRDSRGNLVIAGSVSQFPTNGFDDHGTHVSGIAAGRGNSQRQHRGMAHDAEILWSSYDLADIPQGGTSNELLDAFQWMIDEANSAQKPLVVNASFGEQLHPHDGQTLVEQALNAKIVGNKIFVKSAGNDGDSSPRIHFQGQVPGNAQALQIEVQIPGNYTYFNNEFQIEVWFPGTSQFEVRVADENNVWSPWVTPGSGFTAVMDPNDNDYAEIYNSGKANYRYNSADHVIFLSFVSGNDDLLDIGTYRIELRTAANSQGGTVNAYSSYKLGIVQNNQQRFERLLDFPAGDNLQSISFPGYASQVITVAAHYKGNAGGGIASFSSKGPSRIDLPGFVSKPDIAAPGVDILSAFSGADNQWDDLSGTSMAAPHVTGAIALLLQSFPKLAAVDVKTILQSSAQTVSGGATTAWGAGKLDILAAYRSMIGFLYNQTFIHKNKFKQTYEQHSNAGLPIEVVDLAWNGFYKQRLTNGAIVYRDTSPAAYWLGEGIFNKWIQPSVFSVIGAPTSSEYLDAKNNNYATVDFEHGRIYWDGAMAHCVLDAVTVALVIDRSGSMAGVKIADAKKAAIDFVDFMQKDDKVAIVSFATTASTNFALTTIVGDATKTSAKTAINSIAASGNTSIGAGMQFGQAELNKGGTNDPYVMLLLSDGIENTPPLVATVLPTIPQKTDIYTIGLGADVDAARLKQVADATGGTYHFAPTSATLGQIYTRIRGSITGQQTLAAYNGTISQGGTQTHNVTLDALTAVATFLMTFQGSDVDLELVTPSGRLIDPQVAASDPNIEYSEGSTSDFYTVSAPEAGQWMLRIKGVDVPRPESYFATVQVSSQLKMQVTLDKNDYNAGDPILISANLQENGKAIAGASVSAEVTLPSTSMSAYKQARGSFMHDEDAETTDLGNAFGPNNSLSPIGSLQFLAETIILFDDGNHNDGAANDGVYANFFRNTAKDGSYTFTVRASGTALQAGVFMRETAFSTFVKPSTNPLIISVQPDRGQAGQTLDITLTGANFANGATVLFSGSGIAVNSSRFVSSTQMSTNITIAPNATSGPRDVTVRNPNGQNGTGTGLFTVETTCSSFADDFNDGNADGWQPSTPSQWNVVAVAGDPAYCLAVPDPTTSEYSLLAGNSWGDFSLEIDAQASANDNKNFFLLFGVVNTSDAISNSYYLQFALSGVRLFRTIAGSGAEIAFHSADFVSDNNFHKIRVVRQAPNIKAYADGQLVIDINDATFTNGLIGFGSFKSTACFDDVSINCFGGSGLVGPVIYSSHFIDDVPGGTSPNGDGDGRAESGEQVALAVTLLNQGAQTAVGVESSTLTCSDPDIIIVDSDNCWPDIPGGESKENACNYEFQVNPNLTQSKTVTFSMTVTAQNGGPWTSTFAVQIYLQDQLTAPSNLTASVINSTTVKLNWQDNSPNEQGFKIERKLGASGSYGEIANVGANVTSYTDAGLSAGQTYFYRIRSFSGSTNSIYSNETSVSLPPPTAVGDIKPVTASGLQAIASEFLVDITVANVQNFFGVSFELNYTNTAYIDVVTPASSNVLPGPFMGNDVIFVFNVDEGGGKVSIGVSRKSGQGGVSGSGVVASIRFKSLTSTPPNTQVVFTLTNVAASDQNGGAIPLTASSHTVTVIGIIVWPGDTNNDKIVNQADVLPLGLYWNRTGLQRANASSNWIGQPATPWSPENATYADANGDGNVNQADVLPIGLNWGRTHSARTSVAGRGDAPIFLDKITASTIRTNITGNTNPGQDFDVEIVVDQVTNLFGVSFELLYSPTTLVDPQTTEAGNFMGNDVIFFPNTDKSAGKLSIGVTRKAGQGAVNGSGVVAKINMRVSSQAVRGQAIILTLQNVTANDPNGQALQLTVTVSPPVVVSVALRQNDTVPATFALYANTPNPFNPTTKITYDLPEPSEVNVEIFDMLGKRVRTLVNQRQSAGRYSVVWDGRDENGQIVSSGIFIYQLRAGKFVQSRKMLLLQ
jgi:uncharacterized protein YegL